MNQKAKLAPDRRNALLDTAFTTFVRFGYRKTSMDDVAREAEISRQALYSYFADKDALFRECMKRGLDEAMAAVEAVLDDEGASLNQKLVRALDEWVGRHLEKLGTDGTDLGEVGRALLGNLFADYGATFERRLGRAIAESPLAATCKSARVTPLQLAQTLHACARGWKYRTGSRIEFVAQMQLAVRLFNLTEKTK